jgi:hypothetical protein
MTEYCCEEMKKLNESVSGMDFENREMLVSNGADEDAKLVVMKYCLYCGRKLE